jgi:hypothetical protein
VLVGQASVQLVLTITRLLGNVSSKDVCRSDGGLDTARYPVSQFGNTIGTESSGCDGGCDGLSIRGVRDQADGDIDHVVAHDKLHTRWKDVA